MPLLTITPSVLPGRLDLLPAGQRSRVRLRRRPHRRPGEGERLAPDRDELRRPLPVERDFYGAVDRKVPRREYFVPDQQLSGELVEDEDVSTRG